MGEIADMMIGGEMCPCGEYLGGGDGFPQYCSKQCARDYGGGDDSPAPAQPARPKDTINGIWLDIAREVAAGADSIPAIARALHDYTCAMDHTKNVVTTNIEKMVRVRVLRRRGRDGSLELTKKGRQQLANSVEDA